MSRQVIVNVRGTHGSGKTHLVRRVMARCRHCEPLYREGRTQPIGYLCERDGDDRRKLLIVGHYEGDASGGCDTIPKVKTMYGLIIRYAMRGCDVLFEGILAQHSTPNIAALHDRHGFRVHLVYIDVRLPRAIRSVRNRRLKRGNDRPFDPKNVLKEDENLLRSTERLRQLGLRVTYPKTRAAALARILSLLHLS